MLHTTMATAVNNVQPHGTSRDPLLGIRRVRTRSTAAAIALTRSHANAGGCVERRSARLEACLACLRAFRRAMSIVLLSIPYLYGLQVLIGAGIMRPDLVDKLRLATVLGGVVDPVHLMGSRIFAVSTTYHGVDVLLVVIGTLTVVLRSIVLSYMNRFYAWVNGPRDAGTDRAIIQRPQLGKFASHPYSARI